LATLAVEFGISPNDLLDAPDGILEAMLAYLKEKAKANKHGR
jgi:hypothetical protein